MNTSPFPCPQCQSKSKIVDVRFGDYTHTVRRRRECAEGHRFSTVEVTGNDYAHMKNCQSSKRSLEAAITCLQKLRNKIIK